MKTPNKTINWTHPRWLRSYLAYFSQLVCAVYCKRYVSKKGFTLRILIFLLLSVHFIVSADTCMVSDEMMAEFRSEYFDKIAIETSLVDSTFLVTINLPSKIENQTFYTVFLASGSPDNPSFVAPLDVFYDQEKSSAWYQIDTNHIGKQNIIVGIDEYCAPSIIKEVSYK